MSDNNQRWGFSVRIFVPSGEPEGLRVIEKSNWTGQGLVFPRSLFPEVRAREELGRTGIYVLWEVGTSGQLPRVYVGEGDLLRPRLDSHVKSKDFWTHGVIFTSKFLSGNVDLIDGRGCGARRGHGAGGVTSDSGALGTPF